MVSNGWTSVGIVTQRILTGWNDRREMIEDGWDIELRTIQVNPIHGEKETNQLFADQYHRHFTPFDYRKSD